MLKLRFSLFSDNKLPQRLTNTLIFIMEQIKLSYF